VGKRLFTKVFNDLFSPLRVPSGSSLQSTETHANVARQCILQTNKYRFLAQPLDDFGAGAEADVVQTLGVLVLAERKLVEDFHGRRLARFVFFRENKQRWRRARRAAFLAQVLKSFLNKCTRIFETRSYVEASAFALDWFFSRESLAACARYDADIVYC
jgi:hypothetical protein